MAKMQKIEIVGNVNFGGQHYAAGAVVEVVPGVAEQLISQGLGVLSKTDYTETNEQPESEPVVPIETPVKSAKGRGK